MNIGSLSKYISFLLRHHPESIGLDMDVHGYVDVNQLIHNINEEKGNILDKKLLDQIVYTDNKQRYKYKDHYIKACQGHSIPWVIPELYYGDVPDVLYHGTTLEAYKLILSSGHISKMSRHAVHTQKDISKAWQSAKRWKKTPVVLEIDAQALVYDGYNIGVSDNQVWCIDDVPSKYIKNVIYNE